MLHLRVAESCLKVMMLVHEIGNLNDITFSRALDKATRIGALRVALIPKQTKASVSFAFG